MTPHQFEADYAPRWDALERGLQALDAGHRWRWPRLGRAPPPWAEAPVAASGAPPTGAQIALLYRQCCEHLALARERAYPLHLVERLEGLTARAHQRIYRRSDYGLARLRDLVLADIPAAVRALGWHFGVALLVLMVPTLAAGLATYLDPHFVLTMVDAQQVANFDKMYGPAADHLGRTAGDDWTMFGYYIMNNIGIAFRCFAAGLTLGVGSLLMLLYNGLLGGAVGGYLVARGDGLRFFSFIVTHSAFELTAIVLAGACGLRLGHALLAPGRLTRVHALQRAAAATAPVVYGLFAMLVIAAALEAFWSSAGWVAPGVKFAAGALCWGLVVGYLGFLGRGAAARAQA